MNPDGVDGYFDNVDGETPDAMLMRINRHARVVLYGDVSQYGDMTGAVGPANYLQPTSKSGHMQGFLHARIENLPAAFRMLFSGENPVKLLLCP